MSLAGKKHNKMDFKKKIFDGIGNIPTKELMAIAMVSKGQRVKILVKERKETPVMSKKFTVTISEMSLEDGSGNNWNWKGWIDGKRCKGFLSSNKKLFFQFSE